MIQFAGIKFNPNFNTDVKSHFSRKQKYVDSECLRLSDPYVPKLSSDLIKSGITGTVLGSGEIDYTAPYAKPNYYENAGRGIEGLNASGGVKGLRGKQWFERMKADHKEEILKGAQEVK